MFLPRSTFYNFFPKVNILKTYCAYFFSGKLKFFRASRHLISLVVVKKVVKKVNFFNGQVVKKVNFDPCYVLQVFLLFLQHERRIRGYGPPGSATATVLFGSDSRTVRHISSQNRVPAKNIIIPVSSKITKNLIHLVRDGQSTKPNSNITEWKPLSIIINLYKTVQYLIYSKLNYWAEIEYCTLRYLSSIKNKLFIQSRSRILQKIYNKVDHAVVLLWESTVLR